MLLSKSEKNVIFSNIDEINDLFNVSEEREFLLQYFSEADIEKCLKKGKTRYDQTEALCIKIVKSGNKEFFDALSQHFLKRSDRYKKMFEKMCPAVEMSSREESFATTVSSREESQYEMSTRDHFVSQQNQDISLSDITKELYSMTVTINVLREKIYQLQEEREFWMTQSAEVPKLLDELQEMMKQRSNDVEPEEKQSVAVQSFSSTSKVSATQTECGIQLFQYSAEARRRAEVEIFDCGLRSVLCSASGLFNVETGEQGGDWDWSTEWRKMVDGRGGGLEWWLMMPHPIDNLVVGMQLGRRNDTLVIRAGYHTYYQRGNVPPHFTICCEVSVIIEHKDRTSATRTQRKQHRICLGSWSDLVTFASPNWSVVNPQKPLTVKIQLINVEL